MPIDRWQQAIVVLKFITLIPAVFDACRKIVNFFRNKGKEVEK